MYTQGRRNGSITRAWLQHWNAVSPIRNPPHATAYPLALGYIQEYANDMAYMPPMQEDETPRAVRKQMYGVLDMLYRSRKEQDIRVINKHPHLDWARIWNNLRAAWLPSEIRSEWYAVIHELLPTNDRLHRIALKANDQCGGCQRTDSTAHRIMECGEGRAMWHWTRMRIAAILRTELRHIPQDWPLHPTCDIWPPTRRRAVLWMLAHFVYFQATQRASLTLLDYADFMRRARWKTYGVPRRAKFIGNYLVVL
jgi:hypothetical protein